MTDVPLTERALRMLDTMPDYHRDNPASVAAIQAAANEIDRLHAHVTSLQQGIFPQLADDTTNGLLPLHEQMVGLNVQPDDATIATRREAVIAFRKRRTGSGAEWVAALTQALGTSDWTYIEKPGKRVTLYFPYLPGSFRAATAEKLARRLTGAHLNVVVAFKQGFIIGESLIGVEPL